MFFRHTAPAILWALLILLLCGMPGESIPELDFWDLFQFDKIIHAGIFSMQVLLLSIGFKKQYSFPGLKHYALLVSLLAGIAYGIITEYLQLLVFSGRSFDFLDMLANILGAFSGLLIYWLIYRRN